MALQKKEAAIDWEFGYEIFTENLKTVVFPNTVLRYGISDRLEVNVEINPITVSQTLPYGHQTITGIESVFLGTRISIHHETKWLPEFGISAQVAPPKLATKNFTSAYWAPILQCTMQKTMGSHLSVGGSFGAMWDGFSTQPIFIYSISPSYDFCNIWNAGLSVFGFITNDNYPQNNIDFNVSCQLNDKWSLGVVAGKGTNKYSHKGYLGLNGSFGFSMKKKKAA
jgi:hypothetical protein